ncbi:MAG TPA: hypothetical protein PLL26_04690 [Candidatus Dojkabacteria bacterium]|nr:hypothetical protein [Candidatus Dojkabacteria bacterium]
MLNRPKQQTNSTQAVISTDQSFILAKSIGNFTDIVSPFKKIKDRFASKFILPISQLHRVQTLYDTLSSISQYTVIDNSIRFDCVSNLPNDIFGNSTEGFIHFSAVKQHKKDKTEVFVDPKLVFQTIDCEPETFIFDQKIKFKSDFLKAFPIILKPGFIFSTVNKTMCQLFISIFNPKEMIVSECSKYEIINVIQYVLPLWPIFNISIGKSIQIKLQPEFIQDRYCNETSPILLYISYNLDKPEEITIAKIAQNVNVS